jgi:hypothetical protein
LEPEREGRVRRRASSHTEVTAEQVGELLPGAELSVLDEDLGKPCKEIGWERVQSAILPSSSNCTVSLLRELISVTKESNEGRNR